MFGAKESPVSLSCPWGLLGFHQLLPYSTDVLDAPVELEDLCPAFVELNKSHLAIGKTDIYSYPGRYCTRNAAIRDSRP